MFNPDYNSTLHSNNIFIISPLNKSVLTKIRTFYEKHVEKCRDKNGKLPVKIKKNGLSFHVARPAKDWNNDIEWISASSLKTFEKFEEFFRALKLDKKITKHIPSCHKARLISGQFFSRSAVTSSRFHEDWPSLEAGGEIEGKYIMTFIAPVQEMDKISKCSLVYRSYDKGKYESVLPHDKEAKHWKQEVEKRDVKNLKYSFGSGVLFGTQFRHASQLCAHDKTLVFLSLITATDINEYSNLIATPSIYNTIAKQELDISGFKNLKGQWTKKSRKKYTK